MILSTNDYDILLDIAKRSIRHGYVHHAPILLRPTDFSADLRKPSSTFVSLKNGKENLGCRGNWDDSMPLHRSVTKHAFDSAFADYRFPPLNNHRASLATLQIHHLYSSTTYTGMTLSELENLIQPDDTILLRHDNKSALMLAIMQIEFKTINRFITETKTKAGITEDDFKKIEIRLLKTHATQEIKLGDLNEI